MKGYLILDDVIPALTVPFLSTLSMITIVSMAIMRAEPITALQSYHGGGEMHRMKVKDVAVTGTEILTVLEKVSLTECIMGCQTQYGGYCLAIGYR